MGGFSSEILKPLIFRGRRGLRQDYELNRQLTCVQAIGVEKRPRTFLNKGEVSLFLPVKVVNMWDERNQPNLSCLSPPEERIG